nr:hydantoinase B/oxoprolinase family protein [Roseovarius spongiae]
MRIENYSLRPGAGGRGRTRDGHGFEHGYRMLEGGVLFSTYTDRFNIQPRGLAGGEPGASCSIRIESDGREIALTSRASRSLKKASRRVGPYEDPAPEGTQPRIGVIALLESFETRRRELDVSGSEILDLLAWVQMILVTPHLFEQRPEMADLLLSRERA